MDISAKDIEAVLKHAGLWSAFQKRRDELEIEGVMFAEANAKAMEAYWPGDEVADKYLKERSEQSLRREQLTSSSPEREKPPCGTPPKEAFLFQIPDEVKNKKASSQEEIEWVKSVIMRPRAEVDLKSAPSAGAVGMYFHYSKNDELRERFWDTKVKNDKGVEKQKKSDSGNDRAMRTAIKFIMGLKERAEKRAEKKAVTA